MKNIENNILIAKFMGWEETSLEYKLNWHGISNETRLNKIDKRLTPILIKLNNEPMYIDTMKYDTSWDWLMEVVEKIEEQKHPVYISSNNCIIYQNTGKSHGWMIDKYSTSKLNATYQAIVEFITQYN